MIQSRLEHWHMARLRSMNEPSHADMDACYIGFRGLNDFIRGRVFFGQLYFLVDTGYLDFMEESRFVNLARAKYLDESARIVGADVLRRRAATFAPVVYNDTVRANVKNMVKQLLAELVRTQELHERSHGPHVHKSSHELQHDDGSD
jgi:hypothetical protein